MGEHNRNVLEGTEREYLVGKILIHPNYNKNKLDNNIALLKLTRPVIFDKYVVPVCLPSTPPKVGDNCYISGELVYRLV